MTIDWKSFFGDGRNEDDTYLKFDTFSLMLSPDFQPTEFQDYTEYHSILMYRYPDDEEDVFNEILAFVFVDDYKSGKCRKFVDFNECDIFNAAEVTPEIIQILQELRAFLMKIGFECGGYIHKSDAHGYHNPHIIKLEYADENKTNKDSMDMVNHLLHLPLKKKRIYRNNVCGDKEFANVKDLWSYVKIRYLFDHNDPDKIKAWVNSDHPSDGYYSNNELDEIRDILNKL